MSFGEDESWEQHQRGEDHRREYERKLKEKRDAIIKEISKKSKKELIEIAYNSKLIARPRNSIPVDVEDIEVFYCLETKCFYAHLNLRGSKKIDDHIYLIECSKAYDMPLHY